MVGETVGVGSSTQVRSGLASAPADLAVVVSDLAGFLLPLIAPAEKDERWKPGKGWSASNASSAEQRGMRMRHRYLSQSILGF